VSFGRKGLAAGDTAPPLARPATRRDPEAADIAARREAFLAAERARREAEPATEAPDMLAGLRNAPRPATRRDDSATDSWNPMSEDAMRTARRVSHSPARADTARRFFWGRPERRSLWIAYLFWFIAGQAGLHRFYCGQKQTAFMQVALAIGSLVVTLIFPPLGFVGLVVWVLWIFADLFLIPGMMRRFKAEHASSWTEFA
jgi:hypothetical protein